MEANINRLMWLIVFIVILAGVIFALTDWLAVLVDLFPTVQQRRIIPM